MNKEKKKEWLKNLAFLALLGVLFFTPLGEWVRINVRSYLLFSPSNEIDAEASSTSIIDFPFQLADTSGNSFLLSEKSGRPIFINFFASWCGPCLSEFASMKRMQQELPHIEFLFITNESMDDFVRFVDQTEHDFPFYKQVSRMHHALEHKSIPASYMLSTDGELVYKHLGAADWDNDDVIAELNELSQQ